MPGLVRAGVLKGLNGPQESERFERRHRPLPFLHQFPDPRGGLREDPAAWFLPQGRQRQFPQLKLLGRAAAQFFLDRESAADYPGMNAGPQRVLPARTPPDTTP